MGVERLITTNNLTINNLTTNNNYNNKLLKNKVVKVVNRYTTRRNKKEYTPQAARMRADYLAKKLNDPNSLPFYLKCAWNLTDNYLDRLLHLALKKEKSVQYFCYAAAKEMKANM